MLLPGQLLWRLIVFGVDIALSRSEQIVVGVVFLLARHDVKNGAIHIDLLVLGSAAQPIIILMCTEIELALGRWRLLERTLTTFLLDSMLLLLSG